MRIKSLLFTLIGGENELIGVEGIYFINMTIRIKMRLPGEFYWIISTGFKHFPVLNVLRKSSILSIL